ncbi:protease SohB [Simiduia agarivorans]|uniref:Inner membrane peptidase n=1 Tax=Simiduia agarivorans (strain DSM 21679 / JCM 13881 / BCRC 17597 / SA1) TaxID=1117647 RepID=K4KI74_SIMAS|nr:protease SohB [Simiduia agarivorans]AFU97643.1 inner membrane peptidase [Simiduia agarivorans SA1 = DSM 21679]
MEFLTDYGLFLAKTLTLVVAVVLVIGFAVAAGMKNKRQPEGQVEVRRLNDHYDDIKDMMESALLDEEEYKAFIKQRKKQEKAEAKAKKAARKSAASSSEDGGQSPESKSGDEKSRVFVLDFDGDIRASATDAMREEITALLSVAEPGDEVVIRLESGGGMVHSYGFAASQLKRIRDAGLTLTVCVDKVAASGGYMMACVADRILAAPFAIIGSIGVLAQMPNFHRLLKKHDIDYELITAGEYKRTLTMFGENTRKGRQKFTEEIEDVHGLFKAFVAEHRSQVDIAEVATGEVWFGQQAIDNKLVDELKTSDEYITSKYATAQVFEMRYELPKTLPQKLGVAAEAAVDRLLVKTWSRATQRFYS